MQREATETGRFITFEGGEGSGKSTQAGILANRLARAGRKVFATREPGGSPAAEEIREALLSGRVWQFGPFAAALLFAVPRADFESQELMLHERVRRAFLDIAEEEPDRCVVIDASQPEAMVAEDVWEVVLQRLSP